MAPSATRLAGDPAATQPAATNPYIPPPLDPARIRANAFLQRGDVKGRLIKRIEGLYASPADRVEKQPFADLAAEAVAAAVDIDGLVERQDIADAATALYEAKLEGASVREAISFFRHGYAQAARKPRPIGLPPSATGPLVAVSKVYEDGLPRLPPPTLRGKVGGGTAPPRGGGTSYASAAGLQVSASAGGSRSRSSS